jgi:glycosyltransferase involved in cell wall biosynthesis
MILPVRAGTGHVEQLARARNVELVVDTGLDEAAVVERYQMALMTVCAARLEPFGLTSIESMGSGTPVVAINEAGFRESVVDGITGLLVDPDAVSLASGIGRLVSNPALIDKMGVAGREEVLSRWTWKRTADQLEQILQDASRS